VRFTTVPKTRQIDAVQFLLTNAFQTPSFLVKPEILRRMEATGVVNRIRTAQNAVMNSLLQSARLDRMVEQAALEPDAYAPVEFLAALRRGVWRELATPATPIDTFRRNTQRVYLDTIDNRLNGTVEPSDEVRALLKGELRATRTAIVTAIPAAADPATRRHLEDARDQIDVILDPKAQRARPGVPGAGRGAPPAVAPPGILRSDAAHFDYDHDPFLAVPTDCWIDRVIY
jgi:hypothetical protein